MNKNLRTLICKICKRNPSNDNGICHVCKYKCGDTLESQNQPSQNQSQDIIQKGVK